ncbi:dihydrodipicolinate synthase family protein [Paracoccus beibuensis]|uniref:dihydrodipicolinate synthase family protein n=1 Tax=Paracoccus beibuensis TaxID=547602 RepID=UPI00223EF4B0|nr:dihydrodipicolinate synthase family protein [Paracoccus beibuensis]
MVMRGLSGFPITPTTEDGRPLPADLSRLVRRLAAAGVDSIGVLGSTGGYAYLNPDTRTHVLEIALEAAARTVPVIAGIGALRTDTSVALARHAADAGAAGLLLAPMSYTPLTEDEVHRHFHAVADASDLPICIYNNPSTTHFNFSPALLARLAMLPTVTAVKMPLPLDSDFAAEIFRLRRDLPRGFLIGYSGDWGCADALLQGADAWFSVAAGLWPEQALELTRAARAGDRAATDRLQARFQPLWDLFRAYGSLRVVYAAAGIMGLTEARPPRPILPLPDRLTANVEAAIGALQP